MLRSSLTKVTTGLLAKPDASEDATDASNTVGIKEPLNTVAKFESS